MKKEGWTHLSLLAILFVVLALLNVGIVAVLLGFAPQQDTAIDRAIGVSLFFIMLSYIFHYLSLKENN
ncbi:hypothetical protein KKA66_03540 [Patescibacteria group bacterium]|nr:hypothetical protein [Patescibacteria group bacterium]